MNIGYRVHKHANNRYRYRVIKTQYRSITSLEAACTCLACSGFFMSGLITFREADVISVLSEGLDPVYVQHWSYFSRFCGLCKTQMLHSTT